MKTRDVIGKRIVAVKQSVRATAEFNGARHPQNCVDYIELEDGTQLSFNTVETEFGCYFHDVSVYKPPKKEDVKVKP